MALGAAWSVRGSVGSLVAESDPAATTVAAESQAAARLVVRFAPEAASGRLATRAEAEASLHRVSRALGLTLAYGRPTANLAHLVQVRLPSAGALEDALRRLRADPAVALVEVDAVVRPALTPDDELFNDAREIQWNLKAPAGARNGGANLPTAWDRTRGAGVTVAVLDTGIVTHADLAANVLSNGYDFIGTDVRNPDSGFLVANDTHGRDSNPADPGDWISAGDLLNSVFAGCSVAPSSWHGTAMAGVIAAVGNNSIGMTGVAYESKVLPVRVLGKCRGFMVDVADAIRWASGAQAAGTTWAALGIPDNTTPARVINLSLSGIGTCPADSTLQSAIDAARTAGSVVVVATGNDSMSTIGSPSSCSGVIAVTSHTVEGDKMSTANWGSGTDISAPGGGTCTLLIGASCLPHGTAGAANTIWRELWSTDNTGTTTPATDAQLVFGDAGTSVAAAHVSGAAALLIAAMPSLTPDGVESILKVSSRVFPTGTYCWTNEIGTLRCGTGLLDASAAMTRLTALTPTVTAQTSAAIAAAGSTVTLTGTATPGSAGSTAGLTYRWQQMSGPVVTLSSTTNLSTTFTAPSPGGALSFRFTATDTTGASASATVNMRANTAPTVDVIANQSVRAGQSVTFTATGADVDGDTLTFAATGVPTGATFSSAGVFSWPAAVAGTFTVSVTASEGNLASVARTVTIAVAPNTAPTVNAINNPNVRAGEAVNFTATATDAENDALTFAATGVPTGATFSAAGAFSWTNATTVTSPALSTTSDNTF
ncbi:MAG: S8 family serine peptidase, partial [Gammaproteobacteria bacterium]